jgi:DNA replication protein DnaC
MERFGDVLKKKPNQMMINIIKKKYPKLADVEFEYKQELSACPGCGKDKIPDFFIKRENDTDFQRVPMGENLICVQCEDKQLAADAMNQHMIKRQEKITSQFWIIPPELENESLATYQPNDPEQGAAFKLAAKYLKDFQNGEKYNLLFRGSYGGGKSHLLKGIAETMKKTKKKIQQDGREYEVPLTVGFLTAEDLLNMIKGTFGRREGQTEHDILKAIIGLDFLVIDDLGTESGEWAGKKLFDIINGRIGKPTCYTTNFMEMDQLAKRYEVNGGKIVSRLHSNTEIFDLLTTDMREQKQRG